MASRARVSLTLRSPRARLNEYLTTEINRPFLGPEYCPFRPFVIQEDDCHFLGVIYHHWPADSGSIKTLLREWFRSMYDPAKMPHDAADHPGKRILALFRPGSPAKWNLFEGVLSLLRYRTRFSPRASKPRSGTTTISPCNISLHPQPDGMADRLLAARRRMGYTVNDMFLAAMAETMPSFTASMPRHCDRDELGLGTIVDLRMLAERSMDDLFGMFLGFTNTIVRRQDLDDWPRLLSRIAKPDRVSKAHACLAGEHSAHGGADWPSRISSRRKWIDLYRRRMPMAAGISNINMNRHWTAEYCPSADRRIPPHRADQCTSAADVRNDHHRQQIQHYDDEADVLFRRGGREEGFGFVCEADFGDCK